MYGNMGFGWIGMIIFWTAFIWLIIWLVRQDRSSAEVLKQRYANGEITKKEVQMMKQDIG